MNHSLYPTTEPVAREWVEGNPVIPWPETVEHMQEYPWNVEPALEMIVDEYDVDIDVDSPDHTQTP